MSFCILFCLTGLTTRLFRLELDISDQNNRSMIVGKRKAILRGHRCVHIEQACSRIVKGECMRFVVGPIVEADRMMLSICHECDVRIAAISCPA